MSTPLERLRHHVSGAVERGGAEPVVGEPVVTAEQEADYAAYVEEMEALESGRATRLVHCYLCYLAEHGAPDFTARGELGPLRGVMSTFVGGGSDPTEVLVLNCGHAVI